MPPESTSSPRGSALAAVEHGQQRKDRVRENGVGHRHVDVAATAAGRGHRRRRRAADQRTQRAAEQVADLEVGNRRRAAGDADLVEQAAVAQVVEVVAGAVAVRPVLPVAGDRAVNDARVDRRTAW
jgi:hypothetical protein